MKKKLLLISLDAMIGKDIEILKTLPTFGPILEKASINLEEFDPRPNIEKVVLGVSSPMNKSRKAQIIRRILSTFITIAPFLL